MGGGGGYVGSVDNSAIGSVDEGYASVGTDAGHQGSAIEARWALGHPDRAENFGHLAVHRTAGDGEGAGEGVLRQGSGALILLGCSNGGRQALMEAQRYPDGLRRHRRRPRPHSTSPNFGDVVHPERAGGVSESARHRGRPVLAGAARVR